LLASNTHELGGRAPVGGSEFTTKAAILQGSRTRTNTNPKGTEANAAGRSVRGDSP
jgi:hypothetical protein